MTRRAMEIELDSMEEVPAMRDGLLGWRYHWRHGLVGAVNYWAHRHRANVIKMLVGLANEFGVADAVGEQLDPERASITTERTIARNVKGAVVREWHAQGTFGVQVDQADGR